MKIVKIDIDRWELIKLIEYKEKIPYDILDYFSINLFSAKIRKHVRESMKSNEKGEHNL